MGQWEHYVNNRVSADCLSHSLINSSTVMNNTAYDKSEACLVQHNKLCFYISALLKERGARSHYSVALSCSEQCVLRLCFIVRINVFVSDRVPPHPTTLSQFTFLLISFVNTPSLQNMIKAF